MSSKITEQQVRDVAMLSRLNLNDTEIHDFARQLSSILSYVDKLNELDTDGIEPLAHCLPVSNVFREDEPHQPLEREKALHNAPHRDEQFFRVPPILDDNSGA
jgi:aspartyl-tRNA(Asn)/glutamyl-tRNA(Gln) amidotransferase subunit C